MDTDLDHGTRNQELYPAAEDRPWSGPSQDRDINSERCVDPASIAPVPRIDEIETLRKWSAGREAHSFTRLGHRAGEGRGGYRRQFTREFKLEAVPYQGSRCVLHSGGRRLTRPRSQRSRSDEELGAKVRTSFLASDRTYGARRVWRDLLAEGMSCGLHRIERLMRLQALKARPRRRRLPPDLGERQAAAVAPNVLDRTFEAAAPNRKWIADFTYVWTAEGWLYVAAVIDLFSRRVVGWSMSAAMTAQLVTDALVMAIWRRGKPDALLHHSDRGSQYTSEQFQRLMADNGVVCSMSRRATSGTTPRWRASSRRSRPSEQRAKPTGRETRPRADVFDYIERFYNPKRRHSTIGYLSPMEFETKAGLA